jgi:hypothetical protein
MPPINHTLTALRFLFMVTLRKPEVVLHLPFVHQPQKLPVVLSPEEVAKLLDAAPPQIQGGTERGVWRGLTRDRGDLAQTLRHRQRPHGDPG